MSVEQDATKVLLALYDYLPAGQPEENRGRYELQGPEVRAAVGLSPFQINDAVDILASNGYVDVQKFLGTAPFGFGVVKLTSRGRYEAERLHAATTSAAAPPDDAVPGTPPVATHVLPVGSPYGFSDVDWAEVAAAKADSTTLIVVLGYQWKSTHYDTENLERNIKLMFSDAATRASKVIQKPVTLDFRPLGAGYGSHVFNQIARDIISADIAVFDTSDLNPNVMIELGVALTWGVRTMLIRKEGTPVPPSDISGQTWAEYRDDGASWVHEKKHSTMVENLVEYAMKNKALGT